MTQDDASDNRAGGASHALRRCPFVPGTAHPPAPYDEGDLSPVKTFPPIPLAAVAALALSAPAAALDLGAPLADGEGRLAAGLQSSFSSGGLSLKYRVSERITAQGTLGFFGSVSNYGARGLYEFSRGDFFGAYGFAGVGVWRYDGGRFFASESVFGFSGGAGVEYDLRGLAPTLPPVFVSGELGLGVASFDNYDFSSFGLGLGLHYRF